MQLLAANITGVIKYISTFNYISIYQNDSQPFMKPGITAANIMANPCRKVG